MVNGGDKIGEWTADTLGVHIRDLLSERDLRYEQRFLAQQDVFRSWQREKDLRDGQRFEAQQLALHDALLAQEKAVAAALLAAQQAVSKAEIAADKRFEVARAETAGLVGSLADKIDGIQTRQDTTGGHSRGLIDARAAFVGASGLLIAIATLIVYATR